MCDEEALAITMGPDMDDVVLALDTLGWKIVQSQYPVNTHHNGRWTTRTNARQLGLILMM